MRTFIDDMRQFAGSGPIDCIYVVGRQTGSFTLAQKTDETFGSDHFAVSTRFLFSGTVPTPEPGTPTPTPSPTVAEVRIVALLPNPDGPDVGHEWVKLKNNGSEDVDLSGWSLRDEANHTVVLNGTIEAGAELQIDLLNGQMPFNNSGDEIELLNVIGDSVHFVSYSGGDAVSGAVIDFSQ